MDWIGRFGDKRDYSSSLAYGKHTMLESKARSWLTDPDNIGTKETVVFSWQTISASVLERAHLNILLRLLILHKISSLQSSLSAVKFYGLKNGEFLTFLGLMLVERYIMTCKSFFLLLRFRVDLLCENFSKL